MLASSVLRVYTRRAFGDFVRQEYIGSGGPLTALTTVLGSKSIVADMSGYLRVKSAEDQKAMVIAPSVRSCNLGSSSI